MSDDEKKDPFVPPAAAWTIRDIMAASLKDLQEKVVNCSTCPVYMMCETGHGGTGWTCPQCGTTGVWVDEPSSQDEIPDDILVVDCQNHKFERKREAEQMIQCPLCSGGIGELEVGRAGAKNYLVFTEHSKFPVEKRQKDITDAVHMWEKHYAEEAAKLEASKK